MTVTCTKSFAWYTPYYYDPNLRFESSLVTLLIWRVWILIQKTPVFKTTNLTDAKTNLERARYKQREIIANNQRLRADNQALQKELDELKEKGVPGAPVDKKVEDLIEELKDSNRLGESLFVDEILVYRSKSNVFFVIFSRPMPFCAKGAKRH